MRKLIRTIAFTRGLDLGLGDAIRRNMLRQMILSTQTGQKYGLSLHILMLHFQETYNIHTQYPDIFGVNISGEKNRHPSVIPAEFCQVIRLIPGQLYKKERYRRI